MTDQKDPLQSITEALQSIFSSYGVKRTQLGWPDTKYFQVDGNLPFVAITSVGGDQKHLASRNTIHATVDNGDGTGVVYYEQERLFYLLQFSLFTNTPQDRSNIGWNIQKYFTTNPQLSYGIPGVETGIFKPKGIPRDDQGETNFYRRDITFEVTARVLDSESGPMLKTIQTNDHTTGTQDPDLTKPISN